MVGAVQCPACGAALELGRTHVCGPVAPGPINPPELPALQVDVSPGEVRIQVHDLGAVLGLFGAFGAGVFAAPRKRSRIASGKRKGRKR